jgi:hypothetical protein
MPGTQTGGSGVGAPNGQLKGIPDYKDLPPVSGMPHGCTWGLWDTDGQPDDLGTLNKITPAIKLAARDEIQLGISVSINWSLDHCATPHSNRRSPQHRIKPLPDWTGHDDEIHINTQSGSQWDGFSTSVYTSFMLRTSTKMLIWSFRTLGASTHRAVL